MLLTQSTTPIIGWIATLLGFVMEFIFNVLSSMGIQNIGLCIIIFTFFVRIILLPLMIKQQKFTKMTQAMQSELNKIQKKYRGKKDQASMQKQQEETQALYDKYGISPTGGCAQVLIQMPILFALYQVIRKIPAYIPAVKVSYSAIVDSISGTSGYIDKVNTIAQGLNSSYIKDLTSDATANQVIDVLNYFKTETWAELATAFPSAADTINTMSEKIVHMNNFGLGINVAQIPGFRPSVYWVIAILAALFQYLAAKTMQGNSTANDQAAQMNKSMTLMMPLMSLYFCLIMPAGLGIYWVASALFQFVQQVAINKYYDSVDMDALIEENRKKAAEKKAKRKASGKKTITERIAGMASQQPEAETSETQTIADKPITRAATINTKKITYDSTKLYGSRDNADVNYDTLGEIGKGAYSVAEYEKGRNRGGK